MTYTNALFRTNKTHQKIFTAGVSLCVAALAFASDAFAETRSYQVEGLPYEKSITPPAPRELGNAFTFEVTDPGTISAITVDLTFHAYASVNDIKLISPSGTTVWLLDWNCASQPIWFGEKIYENPEAYLFPPSSDPLDNPGEGEPRGYGGPGIPMTYTFSDSGRYLGAGYRDLDQTELGADNIEDSGLCAEYNARTTELPPVWPPVIDPGIGSTANRQGAYWTLPPSQLIAPGRAAPGLGASSGGNLFSDFEGEDPVGTWTLEVDAYSNNNDRVWNRVNTLIQAATVNISTTAFSDSAPNITKRPELESISISQSTRLIYTIDNSASSQMATDLSFNDALPNDFFVTDVVAPSTTCGGSLETTVGENSIAFSGGQVLPGEMCEISVSFSSDDVGTYGLEAVVLSSSLGNSRSAASEMQFTAPSAFEFSMSFSETSINLNGTTNLVYRFDNSQGVRSVSNFQFDHYLLDGLVLDGLGPDAELNSNPCPGSGRYLLDPSNQFIRFLRYQVNAGEVCEVSIPVSGTMSGSIETRTGTLIEQDVRLHSPASASLTVLDGSEPPEFSKSFNPQSLPAGQGSSLVYTISAESLLMDVSELIFRDTLPTNVLFDPVRILENTCSDLRALEISVDRSELSLLDGSVSAGQACTITVGIEANTPGQFPSVSGDLESTGGNSGPAIATLIAASPGAPIFSKTFSPVEIVQGEVSRLTYQVDNSENFLAASSLVFSETLPDGLQVSENNEIETTCGGMLSAASGSQTISFSDGTAPATESCTISVNVTAVLAGSYDTVSGALTSSAGQSGIAEASLSVTSALAPVFSKVFDPNEIEEGETSALIYTINNTTNLVSVTEVAFAETLPAGLSLATDVPIQASCAGETSLASDATTFSLSDGVVPAEEICTIEVAVIGSQDGAFTAISGELTSSLGNSGTSSADITVLDVTPPTVVITAETESFVDLVPIKVTFTFSEDVTGFALEDIVLGSGNAAQFEAVSSTVYTAAVTPTGNGDLTIDVPEGVANDLSDSANPNLAAEQLTIENGIIALTQRAIRNFIAARMDTIVSNEPDLFERLTQREVAASGGQSGFTVDYSADRTFLSFNSSLSAVKASFAQPTKELPFESSIMRRTGLFGAGKNDKAEPDTSNFDVWSRGVYSHTSYGTQRSESGLLYVGADWLLNPDLVVGLLSQFDWTDERDREAATEISGFGWMAGPYAIQRLTDRLILDGRVAIGQSDNRINPIGRYRDKFDTDRVLVSSQLTGDFERGLFVINPFVQAIYMEERQNDYTDTLGNLIGEQTVSLGRINIGPKIRMVVSAEDGTMTTTPYVKLEGLYDFRGGQRVDFDGQLVDEDRLRGRFTGGMNLTSVDGWNVSAEGFLDGIGQSDLEAYGASFNLSLSF